MSLNGLDNVDVKEAYDAAVAEPGGWLLLKYASRDEIELLGKGNGGIVEVRNNIVQNGEASPLYGFLRYRRRNVVLKYMPADCSRLVKARATVHFNAVCEKFTPYATTFELAEAKDLSDSKLSAACSLHTASGSISSSTSSLRRRRLMEIAEEEEEEQQHQAKRQSLSKEEGSSEGGPSRPVTAAPSEAPVTLNSDLATVTEAAHFADTSHQPWFEGSDRPASSAKSFDISTTRRKGSNNSYAGSLYTKARVKLGPRPSVDASGNRRLSGEGYRPISSLPAGLKLFSKGGRNKSGSKDSTSDLSNFLIGEEVAGITFLSSTVPIPEHPPPPPEPPSRPQIGFDRPATSSGVSFKSVPNVFVGSSPVKSGKMTQEKARLMKAMQLREKQKKKESAAREASEERRKKAVETEDAEKSAGADAISEAAVLQADAAASSTQHDQASIDTRTDSSPTSPAAPSSEVGDSTNASSVSEATEETTQPKDEEVANANAQPIPSAPSERQSQSTLVPKSETESAVKTTPESRTEEAQEPALQLPISKFAAKPKTQDVEVAKQEETVKGDQSGEKQQEPAQSLRRQIPTSKYSTQDLRARAAAESLPPVPVVPVASTTTEGAQPSETAVPAAEPAEDAIQPTDISTEPSAQAATGVEAPVIHEEPAEVTAASAAQPEVLSTAPITAVPTEAELPVETNKLAKQAETPAVRPSDEPNKAVLEAAMPVQGSKASRSRTPSPTNRPGTPRIVRTISSPVRGGLQTPAEPIGNRATSSGSSFLQKLNTSSAQNNLAPPKSAGKAGMSIAQRIKALEKLSANNVPAGNETPKERPSSTFFSVRKQAPKPPRSPTLAERAELLSREITPSPPRSRESTADVGLGMRDRSNSISRRLTVFEGGNAPRGRPDTVQVVARIVRDPPPSSPRLPEPRTAGADSTLQMKQAELTVTRNVPAHSDVESDRDTVREPSRGRTARTETRQDDVALDAGHKRRSSFGKVRDFIKDRRNSVTGRTSEEAVGPKPAIPSRSPNRPPSTQHNGSLPGRLTLNNLKRASFGGGDRLDLPPSPHEPTSPTSAEHSGEETSGNGTPGKSPASATLKQRFMRRLSSLNSGKSNKSITAISPIVDEEDIFPSHSTPTRHSSSREHSYNNPSNPKGATVTAHLGDVNVQFPDNLLWKRRTMCLDSNGFVVLSVHNDNHNATARMAEKEKGTSAANHTKRYHLSEFKAPYAPEIEMQELPNSVCMDFVDGRRVQFACEDRAGQMVVLDALTDAHREHAS